MAGLFGRVVFSSRLHGSVNMVVVLPLNGLSSVLSCAGGPLLPLLMGYPTDSHSATKLLR